MLNRILRIIENRTELKKEELIDISNFGGFYCVGLMNYYLFPLICSKVSPDLADETTGWSHLAYIFGGLFFGLGAKKMGVRLMLHHSIKVSCIGSFVLGGLMLFNKGAIPTDFYMYISVARAIFGFGFSAGFGLIITMVVEKFPRHKRTWAVALVCFIGFSGPILGTLLSEIPKPWLLFFLGGAANCYLLQYTPLEASMRLHYTEQNNGKQIGLWHFLIYQFKIDFWQFLKTLWHTMSYGNQKNQTSFTFWNALVMGIGVQFCVFLVQHSNRLGVYKALKFELFGLAFTLEQAATTYRALGIMLSILVIAWWSKKKGERRTIIIGFQCLQLLALVIFFLYFTILKKYLPDTEEGIHRYFFSAVFFIGFTNGIWFLIFLHISEQLSIEYRPILLTLIPNIYRVSMLAPTIYDRMNSSLINIIAPKDTPPSSMYHLTSHPMDLLACGLLFVVMSILGTFNIKDNFEGDAFPMDEESNTSLISSRLRQELESVDEGKVMSKDSQTYLKEVNSILFRHFKNKLSHHFFLVNIFYFDKYNPKQLGSVLPSDTYNKEAYKSYNVQIKNPIKFHDVARRFIHMDKSVSLSKWATSNPSISGIYLWRSAKYQKLNKDEKPTFREESEGPCFIVFDLSTIDIDNIDKYCELIKEREPNEQPLTEQEANNLLKELVEKAQFRKPEEFDRLFKTHEVDEKTKEKLKVNILLHRLDAEAYPQGGYHAYFIKPHTMNKEQQGIMFIKTIVPLKKFILGQSKDIITAILLQKANAALRSTNEVISLQDSHAKRHELTRLLGTIGEAKKNIEYLGNEKKKLSRTENILIDNFNTLAKIEKKQDDNNIYTLPTTETGISRNFQELNRAIYEVGDNTQRLEKEMCEIESIADNINDITNINYALMKKRAGKEIYLEDLKYFDNKRVSLQEELLLIIQSIQHGINVLRINHQKEALAALDQLKIQIQESIKPTVQVMCCPPMLRVALAELIKNATSYSNPSQPIINIDFIKTQGVNYQLHFKNNSFISQDAYDFIKEGTEQKTRFDKQAHSGIRNIKEYFKEMDFNKHSLNRWQLSIDPSSLDDKKNLTDIYIIIPKSDITGFYNFF
jgi:MFS family permease/signal transduction histidine kinase